MNTAEPPRHAISDLARLVGVTPRTIRYYVAQGLLPAPSGAGPGAHYEERHLERLRLIKRLQREHLPLAEIRSQLETLADDQVAELNLAGPASAPPSSSALDYIRSVLRAPAASPPSTPPGQMARLSRPSLRRPAAMASELRAMPLLRDALPTREASREGSPTAPTEPTGPNLERSQWERLSLGSNLELHIRRPLSRHEQRRVERLITIARQVLKEELP